MPRKVVQGPIRDKEKTKLKLLNAVGKLIKTKGYSSLLVSKIAAEAGCDKKLIYEYFGSTEKLIEEYVKKKDYWTNFSDNFSPIEVNDGGKELAKVALVNQFQNLGKNIELQKILLWELSESKPFLKKLNDQREEMGENIFHSVADEYFGEDFESYRAKSAIMAAGIYYLNLFSAYNGTTFCGINLKNVEGRKTIEDAIVDMIDMIYENKKNTIK